MKFQILPNWFKKIGLILFVIFSFLGGGDDAIRGFYDGLNGLPYNNEVGEFTRYFGATLMHTFDIMAIIGMIFYMMSKEKVEDDYINKLRLESFQLTALIGLFISLVMFFFYSQLKFYVDDFITMFLFIYLIIFFIKKRIDL